MKQFFGVMLVGALMAAGPAWGAILLDHTFDSDAEGWTLRDETSSNPWDDDSDDADTFGQATLGSDNALSFGINSTGVGVIEDHIGFDPDGLVTGVSGTDWAGNVANVSFDFYNADNPQPGDYPASLSLYFISDDTGGNNVWYYDFDPSGLSLGWNRGLSAFLGYDAGWYNFDSRTAGQFVGDLGDVDEIGILIGYQPNQGTPQGYGLDNFQLDDDFPVPEPETYAMLGFAVLSIGFTFRRRLEESLETALQTLRS